MDAGQVGGAAHQAVEGVDFADQVALADAADGGVAGHLADAGAAVGDQDGAGAHAGGGGGGFAAGVASANDDDVEGSAHGRFIGPRGLFANTELAENGIEDVFDADGAGEAAEGAHGHAEVLAAEFG